MSREGFRWAGVKSAVDGAAISEANGRRLNSAKGLAFMGDLDPGRSNGTFDRPRNMHIIGRDTAFDMAAG